MASEEQESKLRTWIEGYGRFGGTHNPDVSMSNNFAGRHQVSAKSANPYEVADDLRRYLKTKGYEQITSDRFLMVMRSAGWSTFFDPFVSSLSGSSMVFRNGWDEAWELHHPENSVLWKVERFNLDPNSKHDGWRIAFPFIYTQYSNLCFESNREAPERAHFINNWLSCGLTNLQKELHWMYLFSGPSERDHWCSYFNNIEVLIKWLETGIEPEKAKRLEELGFDPGDDLSVVKTLEIDEVARWRQSDYSQNEIIDLVGSGISKDLVDSWRDSGVVPISDVGGWFLNGFPLPKDAEDWVLNGFHVGEAVKWKKQSFDRAFEARKWNEIICRPDLARLLIANGCELSDHQLGNSNKDLLFHRTSGKYLGYRDMKSIEFLPLSTVIEILNDLQDTKFEVSQVIQWRSLGFDSIEYTLWIEQGLKPDVAARYKKYNYGPIQSKDLINRKIPPTHAVEQGIDPTGA